MSKDRLRGNWFLFHFPTIVVCDQRHCRERNFRFASQFRFRQIRHPDHIESMTPVQFRFRARRKRRPVHVHVGAAIVRGHANFFRRIRQQIAQLKADRFGKGNVRSDSFAEKCVART